MKTYSLIVAAAIVLVANAFALIHVARNRMGAPDAAITLTARELVYLAPSAHDEDSGVTLSMSWADDYGFPVNTASRWLTQEKLQQLGFDCSVPPDKPDAERFYQRQRSRQAFVALEYDGPAWRAWREDYDRNVVNRGDTNNLSHLVAIDVDLNAESLRARHPDRASIIIIPALVNISLSHTDKTPEHLIGFVHQLNPSLHVPRPYSDQFHHLKTPAAYQVKLQFGRLHEPWVTGVEQEASAK